MKVYSVLQHEKYQGYELLVIYGSRQECLSYIQKLEGYKKSWYEYGVVESELGQEIDFFGMVDWVDPVVV